MAGILGAVGAGSILLVAGFGILFSKLINSSGLPAFSDDDESVFSPERYREPQRRSKIRVLSTPGPRITTLLASWTDRNVRNVIFRQACASH